MAEQLGRLMRLLAQLASECMRRLDVSAMRAGTRLE